MLVDIQAALALWERLKLLQEKFMAGGYFLRGGYIEHLRNEPVFSTGENITLDVAEIPAEELKQAILFYIEYRDWEQGDPDPVPWFD